MDSLIPIQISVFALCLSQGLCDRASIYNHRAGRLCHGCYGNVFPTHVHTILHIMGNTEEGKAWNRVSEWAAVSGTSPVSKRSLQDHQSQYSADCLPTSGGFTQYKEGNIRQAGSTPALLL